MRLFDYPSKSTTHQVLEAIQRRRSLTSTERRQLQRLEKGHGGERKFAQVVEKLLPDARTRLYNLHIEVEGSESQFDCLFMTKRKVFHFEIKNYHGDHYISKDRWYYWPSNKEIKNPLHQLTRSNILLREFLHNHNIQLPVESFVVFIHPQFHLYQADMNHPIIFHPQLPSFLKNMQSMPIMSSREWSHIRNIMTAAHKPLSKYEQLPVYLYKTLEKGVWCKRCRSKLQIRARTAFCTYCNLKENTEITVCRHIQEFQLLFPQEQITVGKIYHWCDGMLSKKRIRHQLSLHFNLVKRGRGSHYVGKMV